MNQTDNEKSSQKYIVSYQGLKGPHKEVTVQQCVETEENRR